MKAYRGKLYMNRRNDNIVEVTYGDDSTVEFITQDETKLSIPADLFHQTYIETELDELIEELESEFSNDVYLEQDDNQFIFTVQYKKPIVRYLIHIEQLEILHPMQLQTIKMIVDYFEERRTKL